MIIAFLTNQPELNDWIKSMLHTEPFQIEFQAGNADAYVVCAESQKESQRMLDVFDYQKPVIWMGHLAEEASDRGALKVYPFLEETLDPDILITSAHELYQEVVKKTATPPPAKRSMFRLPPALKQDRSLPSEGAQRQEEPLPTQAPKAALTDFIIRDSVIAVGGFRGCGASTVAWNLAHLIGATLIEGRTTSSLAAWTGDATPAVQAILSGSALGTCSDTVLSEQDLLKVTALTVIDVGSDVNHPAWKVAKHRVWVSTLDAQWVQSIPQTASKLVFNRVPSGWPMRLEDVANRAVDLAIPENGREFLLSSFTRQPWISKQAEQVKEDWLVLVGQRGVSHQQEEVQLKW